VFVLHVFNDGTYLVSMTIFH